MNRESDRGREREEGERVRERERGREGSINFPPGHVRGMWLAGWMGV